MNPLVNGGAGFINSNFVGYILEHHPDYRVWVLDKLTYADGLDNLTEAKGDPASVSSGGMSMIRVFLRRLSQIPIW
jgi:dTDP-glucose 4,6-dehydratase